MAWYDEIVDTTKGNVQGLVDALRNPVDATKQFLKGGEKNRKIASALLQGNTAPLKQAFAEMTPEDLQNAMVNAGVGFAGTIKGVGKTPFELAHIKAQENAALPVEQGGLGLPANNTAMDRAKAMGFDVTNPIYHGTGETQPIKSIDPAKLGSSTKSLSAKKAFWAVDDPTTAEGYANFAAMDAKVQKLIDESNNASRKGMHDVADKLMMQAEELESQFSKNQNQGQNIMPLVVMKKNQAKIDAGGNTFMDMQDEMHTLLNNAIENNYPSVKISNLSDEIDWSRYNPATHYGIVNPTSVRSKFAAFDPFRRNENDILAALLAAPVTQLMQPEEKKKKRNTK